jgi:hypothetical protein
MKGYCDSDYIILPYNWIEIPPYKKEADLLRARGEI